MAIKVHKLKGTTPGYPALFICYLLAEMKNFMIYSSLPPQSSNLQDPPCMLDVKCPQESLWNISPAMVTNTTYDKGIQIGMQIYKTKNMIYLPQYQCAPESIAEG